MGEADHTGHCLPDRCLRGNRSVVVKRRTYGDGVVTGFLIGMGFSLIMWIIWLIQHWEKLLP